MLSPYRVLDLTDEGALLCGQILGDLGADVIVVEPPEGARARYIGPFRHGEIHPNGSLTWWAFNRNKRAITLDLANDVGRERLRDLVRSADFILESYTPGYLDGLGLAYKDLRVLNPRLVMVSITPFGQHGPKARWAAADLTAWAASGTLLMCGDDDRPPVGLSVPQAYLHAGAEAAVGALIAHAGRERDGVGQHVDVSAQTAAMMSTQAMILAHGWSAPPIKRLAGGVNFGGIPLRFVNPAKDGFVSVTFLFGSAIGPFSRRLMDVMYEEGFVDEATRDKDWINYTNLISSGQEPVSELLRCIDAIARFTGSHTKDELFRLGRERGLLIVPVATVEDVVRSEQLESRNFWATVEHPELGERHLYPGAFARTNEMPISTRRRPPLLGEHNAEIERAELPRRSPTVRADARHPLPLEGVKVLEFMWVVAGPWGTRYLSDYGATVIKVESTSRVDTARTLGPFNMGVPGPERSGLHATVNAGKLGVTLDLLHPKGHDLALKLAAWADVVAESFAPGAMRKFGLDYDSLRAVNPNVIMVSSCLNGQTGPQSDLAGFGTMGQQLAGFGGLAGWPDRLPAGAPGAYTDYVAPRFTMAAVLAALDYRRRTGKGQFIDVAQGEAAIGFLGPALLDYTVNGTITERRGNASLEHAPHGVYPVRGDDRWVAVVATNEAHWNGLCGVVGDVLSADAKFATLERRLANRAALDVAIAGWTVSRDAEEVERRLQDAGVPAHRVTTTEDAFADPQLAAREHFISVTHPEFGPMPIENSRMRLSETPARVTAPGPTFGQHNEHVLTEILGLDEAEFVELLMEGVLQ